MQLVRTAVTVVFLSSLLGCAVNEKTNWVVTDSDAYWNRAGYSIKPPSGSNWVKLPTSDDHPNEIAFVKGEGWEHKRSTVYIKGTMVAATSTQLDEPIPNRSDKQALATTLRDHLNRYSLYLPTKLTTSDYDASLGMDCLKYTGTPKIERHRTAKGDDLSSKIISGFFCLHPDNGQFGVIMESHDFATVFTDVAKPNEQSKNFFTSLLFSPLQHPVSRMFKSTTHQVGKAPYQMVLFQKHLWVALRDEDRVVQVDPADGKIIASIPVGKQPVALSGGAKGMWIANSGDGTVTRIDPSNTQDVQTIRVGGKPVSVSVGQGHVWVADSSANAVIRIDPATNAVAATIAVGQEPVAVVAGKDGIWTANAGDGTVTVIDKAHDTVTDTVNIGGRPVRISLADTGAWVADERGRAVIQIDRKGRTVSSRIEVGGTPGWVQAFDGWDLFVTLSDSAKIVRIDPKLKRVFGPPITAEASPRSIVFNAGSLWFANSSGTTLSAVNLNPNGQAVGNPAAP